jgi:hypothetical protein
MSVVRRNSALAAPALAAAILAAGLFGAPAAGAAPASGTAPRVDVPAPDAGTCWNYAYKQASLKTYTGTPTDCTAPHTVETVITLDVPKDVAAKGNNSRELVLWVDARCQVEVNRYAGVAKPDVAAPGTRTWYLWYTPTVKQWKSGAHWVSCAAASVPSDEKQRGKLVAVTGSIAGAADLSKPITFNTDYGTGTYAYRKPMTAVADRPYPGAKLQNRAASFCEKELGHKKFFWYGPSETEWVEGYTAVRCYSLKKS